MHQDNLIKTSLDVDDQVDLVDEVNDKRKLMTEQIESQIEHMLTEIQIEKQNVLIIKGENWNSGVIGIDADRLRDRFVMPAIIITSLEGSEFQKGSVRSIPTINMYQIMENVQQIFINKHGRNPYQIEVDTLVGKRKVNAFGGHAQACGFSIDKNDIPEWEVLLREEMAKLPKTQFDFSYKILNDVKFFDVNPKLLQDLETLSPYGEGFDFPIFCLKNTHLANAARPFGNRMQRDRTPHVEFKLLHKPEKVADSDKKERFLKATGFGLWEKYQKVQANGNTKVDIIFTLDYPHKRRGGKRQFPHLMVLDIRAAQKTN